MAERGFKLGNGFTLVLVLFTIQTEIYHTNYNLIFVEFFITCKTFFVAIISIKLIF